MSIGAGVVGEMGFRILLWSGLFVLIEVVQRGGKVVVARLGLHWEL